MIPDGSLNIDVGDIPSWYMTQPWEIHSEATPSRAINITIGQKICRRVWTPTAAGWRRENSLLWTV